MAQQLSPPHISAILISQKQHRKLQPQVYSEVLPTLKVNKNLDASYQESLL